MAKKLEKAAKAKKKAEEKAAKAKKKAEEKATKSVKSKKSAEERKQLQIKNKQNAINKYNDFVQNKEIPDNTSLKIGVIKKMLANKKKQKKLAKNKPDLGETIRSIVMP